MKKVKIILIYICAFVLGVSSLFVIAPNSNALGNIYNYDGVISSDSSNLGDYAISDVDYLDYSGYFTFSFDIDLSSFPTDRTFLFANISSIGDVNYHYSHILKYNTNSKYFDFNFSIIQKTFAENAQEQICIAAIDYVDDIDRYFGSIYLLGGVSYTITFSNRVIFGYDTNEYTLNEDLGFDINRETNQYLSNVIDMSSETNFFVDFCTDGRLYDSAEPYSLSNSIVEFVKGGFMGDFSFNNSEQANNYSNSDTYTIYRSIQTNYNFGVRSLSTQSFNSYISNYSFDFHLFDFYFRIEKPSYRVNNTLIIYNFDYYNLLDHVSSIKYQLSKDSDYYNVIYNGVVPNDRYLFIDCEEIKNTIFDEYIYLYLTFDNNTLNIDSSGGYYCGFDFNFTYYTQPLVSNKGIYNYNFEKPGYVDMNFSLYPFHIPVLEILENALIFLIFYCPLISDLLELLHLDMFLGGLMNVLELFTTSGLGQFIISCIAFIIFYGLIKLFMPVVKVAYDNSYMAFSRNQKRIEKNNNRLIRYKAKYNRIEKDKVNKKINKLYNGK